MKNRYDFSKGKRGRVLPPEPESESKTRITIRLHQDVVDRFFEMAEQSGGQPAIKPSSTPPFGNTSMGKRRGLRIRFGASSARN
jgi:hypothetical protein